jgi:HK97 family phage major capsid protein
MEVKELTNKIQEAVDELHKAVERQDAEIKKFGEPLAETKNMIDKINNRIDELEVKLQRSSVPTSKLEEKPQKAAFYKFVRHGEQALTPEERKALVEDATGQYLIEPELDAEIVRQLPNVTVVRQLATVRTIGKDRIKIKSIGGVTVGWGKLETGTEITESTLTPGVPTYQYVEDLYGLTKIGEDELMDSDINLEAILAEEFARALGEEEDKQFILGRGHTYNEPEGITKNATLIAATVTTAAAGAVTVEKFMDMVYACPTQFRKNGVFIMNSATELALRKLRGDGGGGAGTGDFLWQPSVQAGTPNTFLGYPIYTQDDMKTLTDTASVIAIFGDIKSGYRIIDRVGMTVQRLTELYAEAGLIGFKIHKRVTGGVMRASQKPIVLLTEYA